MFADRELNVVMHMCIVENVCGSELNAHNTVCALRLLQGENPRPLKTQSVSSYLMETCHCLSSGAAEALKLPDVYVCKENLRIYSPL